MQFIGERESEERGALPLVSLRLGHAAALTAPPRFSGCSHSLPRRRFATPAQGPFKKRPLRIPKTFKNIMMDQGKLTPVAVLVSPMGPLPHSDIWGAGMV